MSGVRLFRGALPKIGALIFGHFHIVVAGVWLWSLHRCISQPTVPFPSFLSRIHSPDIFLHLSFFQPIRTRRLIAVNTLLFLTWEPYFGWVSFSLIRSLIFINIPFFSTVWWWTWKKSHSTGDPYNYKGVGRDKGETNNPIVSECNKLAQKGCKTRTTRLEMWSTETVQELEFWSYNKRVYTQTRICFETETQKLVLKGYSMFLNKLIRSLGVIMSNSTL